MEGSELSFSRVSTSNKPVQNKINVIYAEDNPIRGNSEGSIASEENQQEKPSEFVALNLRSNFDVLRSNSKNTIQSGANQSGNLFSVQQYSNKETTHPFSLKDYGRTSILQPDLLDGPQSNNSWNSYLVIESATSNPSSVSISNFPNSPAGNPSTFSIMNNVNNTGGVSPSRSRRPSRFYTYDKREPPLTPTTPTESEKKQAKSSKSQEFVQTPIDVDYESDLNPLPKIMKRPSIISILKRQSSRVSKDSIRGLGLSPSQINLIDDKVSLYKEMKPKSFQHTPDKQKRKSKLLDRISIIAAKSVEDGKDGKDNPAAIFKRVLKQVNPNSLQKAEKNLRRRFLLKVKRKMHSVIRTPLQVFSPEDKFSLFWNLITPILVCLDTFCTPFQIAFFMDDRDFTFLNVLAVVFPIFFAFDILINFRMAFYNKGVLITDGREIVKHYLREGFMFDCLTVITDILSVAFIDTSLWFFKVASIIRLKKLWAIITRSEDFLIMSRVWNALLKMLKLWGSIIIVAHWLACCLYTVAYMEYREGFTYTWIHVNNLIDAPTYERYFTVFYWSITTMVTVGYGDLVPVTVAERIYTVIAMIISSALFGYSLNTVGEIIREMNREKDQRRDKIRSVRRYMNQKSLGKNIQTRVKNYIQYMIDSRTLYKHNDEEFFSLLSQNLKDEIISEVNGKILGESKLFSIHFTVKAASKLARYMKELFVQPEEIIFDEGDDTDKSIYFIVYGKVQLEYRVKKIRVLEKGENFGELAFFSGQPRAARAKSLFFTNLYKLERDTTVEELRTMPSDFEMFHVLKDNLNLYKDYSQLQLQCYACDQKGHIGLNCSEIHYKPNKEEIIQDYLKKEQGKKRKFKRSQRPRFSARSNLKELSSIAGMIQEDYNDYTLSDEDLSQDSLDNILERNLFLIPGAEANDVKNRKMERKRKSTRMSANLLYEQVNNVNDLIGRRGSQMVSGIPADVPVDPMALKSNGEFIFFSIDKVENFELYYPQNNVIKQITEFEKLRFERLLESRQGAAKALVIRNFGSMLKGNKGPHKSPLFYANLSKERIIQRGRKKTVHQNAPMQRLKTLMENAIIDKKKNKKKKNKLYSGIGNGSSFTSDSNFFGGRSDTESSDEMPLTKPSTLPKGGSLEEDEATLSRSERIFERRQTNPSIFMNKLGSMTPKMMLKMASDLKYESRASSVDTREKLGKDSDHEKGSKKEGSKDKEKEKDKEREKYSRKESKREKKKKEKEKEEEKEEKVKNPEQERKEMKNMLLLDILMDKDPGGRRGSKKSGDGKRGSRSLSQGKLDDMDKLIEKLEDQVDMGQLIQKMVERRLTKTLTAHFGN